MKLRHLLRNLTTAGLLLIGIMMAPVWAAGLLTPADGSLPALEIRDHQVDVLLQDGYSITTIEQVFHNPHGRDLEAIYAFPVPEHGTVAEFTVWIDGKPVTGEVLEKAQAEQVYAQEQAAGRDAGLAGKDAYRTFEIRVSSVRDGQDTHTRIVYLQPVFTARLRAGYPVEAVHVPGIQAAIQRIDDTSWDVRLDNGANPAAIDEEGIAPSAPMPPQTHALDKDIVLFWRLARDLPSPGACGQRI